MKNLFFKIQTYFHKKKLAKISSVNWQPKGYLIPFCIVMIILVLIPILLLTLYAFIVPNTEGNIFSFTLANLFYFFQNSNFLVVFGWTTLFALMTTIICFFMGFPFAYFLALKMSKKRALVMLITMPIWLNTLVKALSIRIIVNLINPQLMGTTFVMILGMVFLFLPFMILSIYNVLSAIDHKVLEASADLGANNLKTLSKIIFPLSIPGVINGIILVFLPALSTLVIPQYLGGGQVITIAKIIENYFINGSDLPMGAAIALVLGAFSLIITYSGRKIQNHYSFNSSKNPNNKRMKNEK